MNLHVRIKVKVGMDMMKTKIVQEKEVMIIKAWRKTRSSSSYLLKLVWSKVRISLMLYGIYALRANLLTVIVWVSFTGFSSCIIVISLANRGFTLCSPLFIFFIYFNRFCKWIYFLLFLYIMHCIHRIKFLLLLCFWNF